MSFTGVVAMKGLEDVLNRHDQKLRSSLVESAEFSRLLMAESKPIVNRNVLVFFLVKMLIMI